MQNRKKQITKDFQQRRTEMKRNNLIALTAAILATVFMSCPDVWAGCGCDHPTPCPADVMPAFSSPGDTIRLKGDDFTMDDGNYATFKGDYREGTVPATAKNEQELRVVVPGDQYSMRDVGPAQITANKGKDSEIEYSDDQFTYLSKPIVLEEGQGHYMFMGYDLAVDTFGVMYVPLDLSNINDATHFMVYIDNLPMDFSSDEVLIYNKDGFNLNLFTLDVEGYEKQWGAWYGAQGMDNQDPNQSDILTYWRHEFYTYNAAHQPGGEYYAHEENEDGWLVHKDDSVHVDHDRLVVAIAGKLRDPKDPLNTDKQEAMEPGAVLNVTVHILQLQTEDPNVWEHPSVEQLQVLSSNLKVGTPYTSGFFSVESWMAKYLGYNFDKPGVEGLDDNDDDDDDDDDDDNVYYKRWW